MTRLFFLHGALHIWRLTDDRTHKRRREETEDLLGLIRTPPKDHPGAFPLVVTEATAEDKLRAIQRSDYPSFAYDSFTERREPLVVCGFGFNPSDAHIARAIRRSGRRLVAVSVRATGATPETVDERPAELRALFRMPSYDSTRQKPIPWGRRACGSAEPSVRVAWRVNAG